MEYIVFPTEALLLGECLGEYATSGGHFLVYVQRRLLPMMPSYVEHKRIEGLGVVRDETKRSLLDLIIHELGESVAMSELDKEWGLSDLYPLIERMIELKAVVAGSPEESDRLKSLLSRERNDDPRAIDSLLVAIAKFSHQSELLELGRSFGIAIAECEQAIEILADELSFDEDDSSFELATYVSPTRLAELASQLSGTVPGVAFELVNSASKQVRIPYCPASDETGIFLG